MIRNRGNGRIYERKGSNLLWCAYYLRGKEFRESTGTSDPDKALRYLKRRIKEVGADQIGSSVFVGPQQERVTCANLFDALEQDYKLRGKDTPQFRSHMKHIRTHFAKWRAVEVTAEAVDKFIELRLEAGNAPATINRSTQLLSQAFKLAIDRRHLSIAPKIRHISEKANARRGFFSVPEFRKLLENLPEHLRDFCEFGYMTGWRKGEIASLRWEDVDADLVQLRAEYAKNRNARSIVASGELALLIERRKGEQKYKVRESWFLSEYVFHIEGKPIAEFRKSWATACIAAGLGHYKCRRCAKLFVHAVCAECGSSCSYEGRLFHDFRRSAVRNMVRAGVPERVAMSISGHKTRAVFDRYNIVNEEDLRNAVERTQAYLSSSGKTSSSPGPVQIRSKRY